MWAVELCGFGEEDYGGFASARRHSSFCFAGSPVAELLHAFTRPSYLTKLRVAILRESSAPVAPLLTALR